jgi:hypothetical protein
MNVTRATERFSRARLIEKLRKRAREYKSRYHFDDNTGTAQLYSRGQPNTAQSKIIERAVAYGRWLGMQDLAAELEGD